MSTASSRRRRRKFIAFIRTWDIPARFLETLLLVVIVIQAKLYWNQIEEMRIDRRAWVAIASIGGFPKADEPFRPTMVITNTGKTFARRVSSAGHGHWYVLGEKPDFVKDIRESAGRRNPDFIADTLLAPNGTVRISAEQRNPNFTFPQSEIDQHKRDISEGKLKFLSFGQVTYDDIFGHHHWLIFCHSLQYDPRQSENDGWTWGNCTEWNNTGDGEPPVRY